MAEIKAKHGISTIKWQDVPKPSLKLLGYKACVEYLASQIKNVKNEKGESIGGGLRFKCLVVDTKKYPLKNKAVGSTNKLVGYLKFYTVHLADGIMLTQRGYPFDITIDHYSSDEKHGSASLGRAIEGRYLEQFKPEDKSINKYKFQHSVLKTVDDKQCNLVQMVDLLAGAVAFVRNGGMSRTSGVTPGRVELVDVIRKSYRAVRLDRPMPFGPFGIWEFKDPGKAKSPTRRGYAPHLP